MKKGFKFMSVLVVSLVVSLFLAGCSSSAKETLTVYNWADYIDESVIKEFEKEFDVRVIYDTFSTNEDMYVKLKSGGASYDVAFPSDYMIERMIKEDMLHKIDMSKVDNYKYIDARFQNLDFDPSNEYSVPYMWGTVGLLYDTTVVKEPVDSWELLWDEKYAGQILMMDSQRDSIGITLKKLGFSVNSRDSKELELAKQELIRQKPLVMAYVVDEVKDMMIGGEAAIAIAWSGDAMLMMGQNEKLAYVVPKEGSNLWFDNMVIPKSAKNKELAEKFINFMTRPEISLKNVEYIEYSTPNTGTMELLDEELLNNPVAYPSDDIVDNCEVFLDPSDFLKEYDRIWTEIKAH
ncbi:ABC transporter substrate-binding protein [Alkaliphilus oremlandii]|uniref:Extracellular solute-binding protein family 1 n=1 Tax=Alkaliphilus oremlandii (strain OhILAs) TaxID=350688 RepID=A8MJT6_ALKOO|nr:ABC transporter substrate-binding protein [Alkaliphilus oremlandii]ABW20068.1 extracellular solute-binding protein family 1 [Alkaliphilus oremlandii OhILAs]